MLTVLVKITENLSNNSRKTSIEKESGDHFTQNNNI